MTEERVKFSDMEYQRLGVDEMQAKFAEDVEKLKAAKSFEEADAIFQEDNAYSNHVETMVTLASVRHSIDTKDEFYDAEKEYWDETMPLLREVSNRWKDALLASPYADAFKAKYGDVMFRNAEIEIRSFRPELVPMMQEENKLVTAYEKLLASAQIPFEGKMYTISQMTPFKTDADDARREAAWKAEGQWYKDNQEELDRLYDQLVQVRTKEAKALGHENYIALGYDRMTRNCYDKNDVEKFRAAVVKYLVPLADSIYKEQAKRLGNEYPMSFADNALEFRSGNPRPQGTPEDILAAAKKFYRALSTETGDFFDRMLEQDLLDVLSKEGKEGGGYCTGIPDYGVPFIFANFNGTQGDVEVVTHEAGHAFAYYMNRTRPADLVWPGMEACEVHSMSMEFLAWPWEEGFFGADTRKFLYSHLTGALTFIPYGTMVDHFQHSVYEHPQWSPRERHDEWKRLLGIYMPWQKLDGAIPFYSEGEGWQRQHHIYSMPFYYIDYCLAQTVALEIWELQQADRKDAFRHYMDYTLQGGSRVFTELIANADLLSPFDETCLRGVCERAKAWLDAYDLEGIA
ncbi:MAG: M3 family oligoendopeptidase [Lachnospiraceae bacterium]|nr:M3 family oligoendopeptidase [Lachnospiraceae bacterium]